MTYLKRLSPWCIVKLLPNMQRQVVARCRSRNDAVWKHGAKQHRTYESPTPTAAKCKVCDQLRWCRRQSFLTQRWIGRIHLMRGSRANSAPSGCRSHLPVNEW